MALAIVLVLLVLGSIAFHFLSPWWFTPIASNWTAIDATIAITFMVTGLVFVAVNLFLACAIVRYRYRRDRSAHYEPENKQLELWLTVLTAVGIIAMLAPGLLVWAQVIRPPAQALELEAMGQQWRWSFRFPGADGVFGTVDARHIGLDNPFGLNGDDPHGLDDILVDSPVLHLPLGHPVKLLLRSRDVTHDFSVPQFRVKMDMVPGQVTSVWFTPTRTGTFDLLCEELCGIAHFAMRGRVVVESEQDFARWLKAQPSFARQRERSAPDMAAGGAAFAICASCHGPQGQGNPAQNAPRLSGQSAPYLRRQLQHFRHGVRGADPRDAIGKVMAPMAATLATETVLDNVVAFITTLPDTPAAATVKGDARRGQRLFTTCATCHGADGRGNPATGAPRLAGLNDWYLARQLRNFQSGARGTHPEDIYGPQMRAMAAVLSNEAALNDVLAYINRLAQPEAHEAVAK